MTKKAETTDIALPTDWQAELAERAKASSASVRPITSTISLRSGIVSYQGVQAPDNKLDIVIIGFAQEHTYYASKYDPDNVQSPDCYALALGGTDVADITPADNVPEPISANCGDCPMLKWGSDPSGGRGKACQQRYRLVAMPANALESADSVLAAEVATVKLPVTSGKNWALYLQTVASLYKRPEWAVVTTLSAKPDVKTQFKALFETKEVVDFESQPELYRAILQKIELSQPALLLGYDMSGETTAPKDDKNAKYAK